MSKKNYKGNRLLKNNTMEIKPNDIAIDPLTLLITKNPLKKTMYFTKFHFDDGKLVTSSENKNLQISNDSMSAPPILISSSEFIKIHNINNINDLIEYINDNDENFHYNNRLINCFIRSNYDDLTKNNKILTNIYLKLFKNFKIDPKHVNNFIEIWFKNNNANSFFLNLGNDLKNYLSNQYES